MVNKKKFDINNTSGQGIMEYIIISSLVGIFCIVAVKQLGTILSRRTQELKKQLVENIKIK